MHKRSRDIYDARLIVLDQAMALETNERITIQMVASSSPTTLEYTRGSTATVMANAAYFSCLSYLDRPVITEQDARNQADLCPSVGKLSFHYSIDHIFSLN